MAKMENNEIKNSKLIPRLRFPGFEGGWEEKALDETGFLTAGGTPSTLNEDYWGGNINWLQSGAVQNCIINEQAVIKKITKLGLQHSAAHLIRPDSVLIAITGATCANVGYLTFESAANQSVVSIETDDDYNAMFLYYKLLMERTNILSYKGGSAQSGVTLKALKGLSILIPSSLSEQQKIAKCLFSMDDLIFEQGRKVDALKEKKKGLMQQLFPQPGETTPRLRFPGFEGEWKAKKLGEMITEVKDTTTGSINIPLYSLTIEEGVTEKTDRYERGFLVTKKENLFKIVSPNDFVSNPMNLRFGAIDYNKNDFCVCVSGYYDVFRFKEGGTTVFWSNYLKSDLMLHVYDVIAIGSLLEKRRVYFSTLQNLELLVPTLPEQQKIASCLSSLDDLIAAESAKVEALKDHKKGLMQQLFPQPTK